MPGDFVLIGANFAVALTVAASSVLGHTVFEGREWEYSIRNGMAHLESNGDKRELTYYPAGSKVLSSKLSNSELIRDAYIEEIVLADPKLTTGSQKAPKATIHHSLVNRMFIRHRDLASPVPLQQYVDINDSSIRYLEAAYAILDRGMVIRNSDIGAPVILSGADFLSDLSFINVRIYEGARNVQDLKESNLLASMYSAAQFYFDNVHLHEGALFEGCHFRTTANFSNVQFDRDLKFSSSHGSLTDLQGITFSGNGASKSLGSLIFDGVSIFGMFDMSNRHFAGPLQFSSCKFEGNLKASRAHLESGLIVSESQWPAKATFNGAHIQGHIEIVDQQAINGPCANIDTTASDCDVTPVLQGAIISGPSELTVSPCIPKLGIGLSQWSNLTLALREGESLSKDDRSGKQHVALAVLDEIRSQLVSSPFLLSHVRDRALDSISAQVDKLEATTATASEVAGYWFRKVTVNNASGGLIECAIPSIIMIIFFALLYSLGASEEIDHFIMAGQSAATLRSDPPGFFNGCLILSRMLWFSAIVFVNPKFLKGYFNFPRSTQFLVMLEWALGLVFVASYLTTFAARLPAIQKIFL